MIGVLLLLAGVLQAQPAGPAFEVASVKPSAPGSIAMHLSFDQGRISFHGATVQFCIAAAWHLQDYEISGGPKWLATDQYDIEARAPGTAAAPELMQMVQNLLADRFQFQFHREPRLVPGYALVVAKSGPKLQPAPDDARSGTGMGRGMVNGTAAPMSRLAESLAHVLGRPVVDETGLSGKYTYRLTWTPSDSEPLLQKPGATPDGGPAEPGPSIFSAIQEQLGLRLEARRVTVQVLVIDRLERPSAN